MFRNLLNATPLFYLSPDEGGGAPAAASVPPVAPAVPAVLTPAAEAKPADALPADLRKLIDTPDAFKARLAEERETGAKAAEKALLKRLGVKDPAEIEQAMADAKKRADAELTETQRTTKRLKELEAEAASITPYRTALTAYLAAEEKAIPEEKLNVLDLAPPPEQLAERLTWIIKAKERGMFNVPAPVVPAVPAAPIAPRPGATTMGPNGPAAPAAEPVKNHYQHWKALQESGNTMLAASYRNAHRSEIERQSPPSK
jgi:hypothetical protein